MASRKRNTRFSPIRPDLRIESLEKRYLLSANKGLAVSTISATADGGWACGTQTNEPASAVTTVAPGIETQTATDSVCEINVAAGCILSVESSGIQVGDDASLDAMVAADLAIETSDFAAEEFAMMVADTPVENGGEIVAELATVVAGMPESDIPDGAFRRGEADMPPITNEAEPRLDVLAAELAADEGSTENLADFTVGGFVASDAEPGSTEVESVPPVEEGTDGQQVEPPKTEDGRIVQIEEPVIYTMQGEAGSSGTETPTPVSVEEERTETSNVDEQPPVIHTLGGEVDPSSGDTEPTHAGDVCTEDVSNADGDPPVIVTLDGSESNDDVVTTAEPTVTTVELNRKDVKRLARELKRGNDVEIDIAALMQLHSRAKKRTRKLVERVIATTHAENQAQTSATSQAGNDAQAIAEAYAALGSPTRTLKVRKPR